MRKISELHYISQAAEDGAHSGPIERALEGGCRWIQLRVKEQPEEKVLQEALRARELCDRFGALLIVNDFPEVALAAGADGLHLGLEDMPVEQARDIVGTGMLIGGTANSYDDILNRTREGVDYIGLGPFRFTSTKKKLSPLLGLDGYKNILSRLKHKGIRYPPIIAIGGIEPQDFEVLGRLGVAGVAMSGAFNRRKNIKDLVEAVTASFITETNHSKTTDLC